MAQPVPRLFVRTAPCALKILGSISQLLLRALPPEDAIYEFGRSAPTQGALAKKFLRALRTIASCGESAASRRRTGLGRRTAPAEQARLHQDQERGRQVGVPARLRRQRQGCVKRPVVHQPARHRLLGCKTRWPCSAQCFSLLVSLSLSPGNKKGGGTSRCASRLEPASRWRKQAHMYLQEKSYLQQKDC